MNYSNLGQEIIAEYGSLSTEDRYTPLKNMEAQSKAIVTHIQTNAEINSAVIESTISGGQSIPSNLLTTVNFEGDNFTLGVFSVPENGTYSIQARVSFSDLTAACSEIYAILKKGGTEIDFDRCPLINEATLTLSKVVDLTTTDTLQIDVYQLDGIVNHILSNATSKTYFTISKIGNKIT